MLNECTERHGLQLCIHEGDTSCMTTKIQVSSSTCVKVALGIMRGSRILQYNLYIDIDIDIDI